MFTEEELSHPQLASGLLVDDAHLILALQADPLAVT